MNGLSSLLKWRKKAAEGSLMGLSSDSLNASAEAKKLKQAIRRLIEQEQRLLGKQSLHIEILRETIDIGRQKKLISRQPLPGVDDTADL